MTQRNPEPNDEVEEFANQAFSTNHFLNKTGILKKSVSI